MATVSPEGLITNRFTAVPNSSRCCPCCLVYSASRFSLDNLAKFSGVADLGYD